MGLIFDIGYNKGRFSREMMSLIPGSKIIGVEANKSLTDNVIHPAGITIVNKLMSSKSGEMVDFYLSTNHELCTASKEWTEKSRHSHYFSGNGNAGVVKVESITIDDLILQYGVPELLKIDVENYEYEVFQGLTKKYDGMTIMFEWCEELFKNTIKCADYLKSLGYDKFNFTYKTDGYFPLNIKDSWENCGILKYNTNGYEHWGMIYCR